jgi:hypothetical protein
MLKNKQMEVEKQGRGNVKVFWCIPKPTSPVRFP